MSAKPRTLALAVASTVALLLAPTAAAPATAGPAATAATVVAPAAPVATAKPTWRLQTKVKTILYSSASGSAKRKMSSLVRQFHSGGLYEGLL